MTKSIRHLLTELIATSRARSGYFQASLAGLPAVGWRWEDIPVTDPATYWHGSSSLDSWPVLTARPTDAVIFKTGGTTGDGKPSVFTRQEWRALTTAFGWGLSHQLVDGDRVANLFFSGGLYASFLTIHDSLAHAPLAVVELPFTGSMDPAELAHGLDAYKATVVAGIPQHLTGLASGWLSRGQRFPSVRTILFGAESMFGDQASLLAEVFPNARLGSVGCGSVDGGLIGWADPSCAKGEHFVFEGETLLEIIDEETGTPIEEPGVRGMLVVTDLHRRLMPVIRYPTGDAACWLARPGDPRRAFSLLGRTHRGHRLRVGSIALFPDELAPMVEAHPGVAGWQWIVDRDDGRDRLTLRLGCFTGKDEDLPALRDSILAANPGVASLCIDGALSIRVLASSPDTLRLHHRSGKVLRVVDLREHAGDHLP
jgi:phenylacetate-CoA ligase